MAATSPFTGTSVQSVDPLERRQVGAAGDIRDQLQSAFRLAYFLHADRGLALQIVKEAIEDLEAAKATQRRRLGYTPNSFSTSCAKPQTPRTKVVMGDAHLLQRLVYKASEPYEIQQERDRSQRRLTEEDMLIRFVKHLVRITVRRSSFYVALGISRLLHGYSTAETMEIYTAVVQDPDRAKEDCYYRACKRELMSELEERFGKALRRTRGVRGEERFAGEENSSRHWQLVRECLSVLTPWETSCVAAVAFERGEDQLSHLAFDGEEPDREHPIEMNRMHAITHPECYRQVVATLGLEKPESRLSLPQFRIDHTNDRRPPIDRHRPPGLTEAEMRGLLGDVDRQADRRRRISARHLSIYVDGARVGNLDLSTGSRFVLGESSELIEVRARDNEGEVKLGAVLLSCKDRRAGEVSEYTVVGDGGQKVVFTVSFKKDAYGELKDGLEVDCVPRKSGGLVWQGLRESVVTLREESSQYVFKELSRKQTRLFGMKAKGDKEVLRLAEMRPINYAELSEALIRGAVSAVVLKRVANQLVTFAEYAYAFRRMDQLEQLSYLLTNTALPDQYQSTGLIYRALSLQEPGRPRNLETAARLLQHVADHAMPFHRMRALNALGVNSMDKGNADSALRRYNDAARLASRDRVFSPPTSVLVQTNRAIVEAKEGNHIEALAVLKNVGPLAESIRFAWPHAYYQYLNSLAVELGETGKLDEAEYNCRIVLASPLAGIDPEWHATKRDLDLKRRLRGRRP